MLGVVMCRLMYVIAAVMLLGAVAGCGGDDSTEADRIGVGAECTVDSSADPPSTCPVVEMDIQLDCLTQFKGGYCGLEGCTGDVTARRGRPASPMTTARTTASEFVRTSRIATNRSVENESNCVGSITFVDDRNERKACEPPSSGD